MHANLIQRKVMCIRRETYLFSAQRNRHANTPNSHVLACDEKKEKKSEKRCIKKVQLSTSM